MTAATWQQRYVTPPLRWSAILIGFAVPISVALDNLLLAILLPGFLFNARAILNIAIHHPVARAAWLLFGMLAIGTSYGATPLREAAGILGKYIDLAFIPLLMLLFADDTARRRAQYAFLAAMALTLLISCLVGLGWLPVQQWMWFASGPENPAIFHSHITHNNMMAFAAFLAMLRSRDAASSAARAGWAMFALLAAINVLFMVQGRTGYLVMMALLAWFSWSSLAEFLQRRGIVLGWRHALALFLALGLLAAAAYQLSSRLHDRVMLVVTEYSAWQPNQGRDTSTGQRMDFYYNTLQIVQQHPLLGVGTGGFPAAFAEQVSGTEALRTKHPHNEYLMIAAQTGIVGLALLLYLFHTLWRIAPSLPDRFERDALRGLVLAYLINAMFNCALLDHSDGLFFAFMAAVLLAGAKGPRAAGEPPH